MSTMFNVFSLRAASQADVSALLAVLRGQFATDVLKVTYNHPVEPESDAVVLEFKGPYSLRGIQMELAKISNSEVMFETLKNCPLIENDLERTYETNPFITSP